MKKEYYLQYKEKMNVMYFVSVEYMLNGEWVYGDILGYCDSDPKKEHKQISYAADINRRLCLTEQDAKLLTGKGYTPNGKTLWMKKYKQKPAFKLEGWQTAINRSKLARPLEIIEAYRSKDEGLSVLDYGCGRGQDADRHGWTKYDPSWFPNNARGRFDVVLCTYVMNVIKEEKERIYALGEIKNHLLQNVGAVAYVTVRRGMKTDKLKNQYDISTKFMEKYGFKSYHKESGFEIYQIVRG